MTPEEIAAISKQIQDALTRLAKRGGDPSIAALEAELEAELPGIKLSKPPTPDLPAPDIEGDDPYNAFGDGSPEK